jgi:hypothetical protein
MLFGLMTTRAFFIDEAEQWPMKPKKNAGDEKKTFNPCCYTNAAMPAPTFRHKNLPTGLLMRGSATDRPLAMPTQTSLTSPMLAVAIGVTRRNLRLRQRHRNRLPMGVIGAAILRSQQRHRNRQLSSNRLNRSR